MRPRVIGNTSVLSYEASVLSEDSGFFVSFAARLRCRTINKKFPPTTGLRPLELGLVLVSTSYLVLRSAGCNLEVVDR